MHKYKDHSENIFREFDIDNTEKVDLIKFKAALKKNPSLFDTKSKYL